jgi:hypothetical protein
MKSNVISMAAETFQDATCQDRLRRRDPDEEQKNHRPLRFQQGDAQHAMRDEQNEQRDEERGHESGEPRET